MATLDPSAVHTPAPRPTRLLVVDDDAVDRQAVRRALRSSALALEIAEAEDAPGALAALREREVDCVLLDLNMPKMNGIEFLRELRADPALHATPVVVLTTSDDERDKVEAYDLNVAGYLLKPVTFTHFVEVMVALNKYWALVEMP